MNRFELTSDLLTAVPDIDEQHRTLLRLANKVLDPSALDKGDSLFREALAFLAGYVLYHFAAEEHVMKNAGYPRFEHHRSWHERFQGQIAELTHAAGRTGVSPEIKLKVSFAIETWLLEHIRITDRDLAGFLRQQYGHNVVYLPDVRVLKEAGMIPHDFDDRMANVG